MIARISLNDPRELLNALYREDADWDYLLVKSSASSIEQERRREDLYELFEEAFNRIPYDAITPRLSASVFKTKCPNWNPKALAGLESHRATIVEDPIVSERERLALMVMRQEDRLRWVRVNEPTDVVFNLVMAHWDEETELLYIHSSSVDGIALQAAKLVAGDDVVALRGEEVFRVLHGFRHVMLNSLGVRETQVKPVKFHRMMGSDITPELNRSADNRSRVKTDLYGVGYVNEPVFAGEGDADSQPVKRGIGCSTKGKIWSQEAASHPGQWIDWCHTIGPKIADTTITTEAALRNVLRPERQKQLPYGKVPLTIEWPEAFYESDENRVDLAFGEDIAVLAECEIEIAAYDMANGLQFRVRQESFNTVFKLMIRDESAEFSRVSGPEISVRRGKRTRPIIDVFIEDPPAIRLVTVAFDSGRIRRPCPRR